MSTVTERLVGIFFFVGLLQMMACHRYQSAREFLNPLDSTRTGIDFINLVEDTEEFNIIQYLYFYNGGAVACGDVNNDGLPDLVFGANQSKNQLYINQGNLRFERDTLFAGATPDSWTTGISMVDMNADGLLDMYICQASGYKEMHGHNALLINLGTTARGQVLFEERAQEYGLDYSGLSSQALFLDYDLDGDLDMFLVCHSVHSTDSYRDTSLTRQSQAGGDKFFRNDGTTQDPEFVDATEEVGIYSGIAGYGLAAAVGDFNLDLYPDIYISNDFHENDYLYLNTGDGRFEEVIAAATGHTSTFSMGCDVADINNDGLLDVISLDMKPFSEQVRRSTVGEDSYEIQQFKTSFGYHFQLPHNCVQINQGVDKKGIPLFAEVAQQMGIDATDWSWSGLVMDLDLDGRQDIFVTNGIRRRPNDLDYLRYIANAEVQSNATDLQLLLQMPEGKVENQYFLQEEESFSRYTLGKAGYSHGAVYADLDVDGDLDLVVNNMNQVAQVFENASSIQSVDQFINIRPVSSETSVLGTKIWVYQAGRTQFREVQSVRGWLSSVEATVYFGLGGQSIDSILVLHPVLGCVRYQDPATNLLLEINFDSISRDPNPELFIHADTRTRGEDHPFRHKENESFDYSREPLIPRLLSREGPALAIGDLNGDGIDEVFVGGASGQPGAIIGQGDRWQVQYYLPDSKQPEDVTACLVDIDQDGDLDLYVGTAGFQAIRADSQLLDRVYVNDGEGNLTYDQQALPPYFVQTGSADFSDVDGDGDQDLFVGGRGVPFGYGRASQAYLLYNDGAGRFSLDSSSLESFADFGMVTDLTFADVDGDADEDIVAVGEWEFPRVLINEAGGFSTYDAALDRYTGWWECVRAADLDSDGHLDLILGNLGANHDLGGGINRVPARLFINDFDANLTNELILTSQDEGVDLPLAPLDELSKALPSLSKKYRSHQTFGLANLEEIFGHKLQRSIIKEATSFQSAVAWNDGSGKFSIEFLPPLAQRSVIRSIVQWPDQDGDIHFLLAGNFYHFRPDIGRKDALHGLLLHADHKRYIKLDMFSHFLKGEVRDLGIAQGVDGKYLVVAKNDDWMEILPIVSSR